MPRKLVAQDRSVSVGTTDTQVLSPNPYRVFLIFSVKGTNDIELNFVGAAAANSGIYLKGGGTILGLDMTTFPWYGAVRGIALIAASQLNVTEVEVDH